LEIALKKIIVNRADPKQILLRLPDEQSCKYIETLQGCFEFQAMLIQYANYLVRPDRLVSGTKKKIKRDIFEGLLIQSLMTQRPTASDVQHKGPDENDNKEDVCNQFLNFTGYSP